MGRNWQIGKKLDVLDRIVANLLVLAACAAWAAASPRPVRWLVAWALRQSDAVARRFLAGPTCKSARAQGSLVALVLRKGPPAGATELAVSLRRLALALRAMVRQLRRLAFLFPRWTAGGMDSEPGPAVPELSAFSEELPDTS